MNLKNIVLAAAVGIGLAACKTEKPINKSVEMTLSDSTIRRINFLKDSDGDCYITVNHFEGASEQYINVVFDDLGCDNMVDNYNVTSPSRHVHTEKRGIHNTSLFELIDRQYMESKAKVFEIPKDDKIYLIIMQSLQQLQY